jgi:hypothetical protein
VTFYCKQTGGNSISINRTKKNEDYDWYDNDAYKASTYSTYGVDTQKAFSTILSQYNDAVSLASDLIAYFKDMHGTFSVTTPMKYYSVNIGDNVDVEIWRETTLFLGTKKCEVLGKSYNLARATIDFKLRII